MADDAKKRAEAEPFPNRPAVISTGGRSLPRHEDGMYESDDKTLIAKMIRNMDDGYRYWRDCYDMAFDDMEFAYEQQWDNESIARRTKEGRPYLTLNYIPNAIDIVVNQARKNRYGIKVMRRAGLSQMVTSARGKKYPMADIIAGIIRDIERRSSATDHYIRGLQHTVEGGFGWLKIFKHQPADDPWNVELRVTSIRDRQAGMIDPFAEQPDGSDAMWATHSVTMPRHDFDQRYGERDNYVSDPGGIPEGAGDKFGRWWRTDRDEVRIVEYWYRQAEKRTLIRLAAPDKQLVDVWEDEVEDILDELTEELRFQRIDEKKIDTYCIYGSQMTHKMILEKPMKWEGIYLPMIPMYGRAVDHNGKTHYSGLVRYAKDAQRMANYWVTAATERVGLAPKDGWLMTDEQYEGHDDDFDPNGKPRGAKTYTHVDGQPPPQREQGPELPAAELSMVSVGQQAVKDTTGIHDAQQGKPSNEVSGRAIQSRQVAGQTATFNYPDNMVTSIRHVGRCLADMVPKIYSGPRLQTIILGDNTTAEVILNQKIKDQESGEMRLFAPINLARYEVEIETGPSFASQREEMIAHLTELGKNNPPALQMVLDIFVQAMDIPFAHEMIPRFKSLVPRHLLSEEDQELIPEPQPTPEQMAEAEKAKAEQAKVQGMVQKAQSDTQIAQIKVQERELQLSKEQLKLTQEQIQLEQEKVKLQKEREALENARVEGESEEEVARRAKLEAADSLDKGALP